MEPPLNEQRPTPSDPSASHHREHHLRTPSPELSHSDKLLREAFHRRILAGVLLVVLAAAAIALVLDLDSWPEWVVLTMVCVTAVGVIIAVSPTRRA